MKEAVGPLRGDQRFDRGVLRIDRADANAVALLALHPDVVCLRKQPAGVEGDDLHVDLMLPQRVEDHLVLEAEARGKDDRSADLTAHEVQSLIERRRRERGRERRRPRPQCIRWKRLASGGQRRIERSNCF